MPITIFCNIQDDLERSKFRQSSPEIRERLQEIMADFDFEIDGFLISSRRSFDVATTAQIFDVSEKTIRRLVSEERLTAFKIRNCLRITAGSIERYRQNEILKYQLQIVGL